MENRITHIPKVINEKSARYQEPINAPTNIASNSNENQDFLFSYLSLNGWNEGIRNNFLFVWIENILLIV